MEKSAEDKNITILYSLVRENFSNVQKQHRVQIRLEVLAIGYCWHSALLPQATKHKRVLQSATKSYFQGHNNVTGFKA